MALREVDTYILLFPNQEWSSVTDDKIEVDQLQPDISFTQQLDHDLRTLSTPVADRDGSIAGFLYVPDLVGHDDCYLLSQEFCPANVTRKANLPPTDFSLVALAPWINAECTLSYLASARTDGSRAFLFFLPNTTTSPPAAESPVWNLGDGGAWKSRNHFPVYAITGTAGSQLMHQLSLYSGNMTNVPYGHEISELPGVDFRDYVRIYTQLTIDSQSAIPSLWAFLLIVVAALLLVLGLTSMTMHMIQRSRRSSLRRRVNSGEVNLEALGIKRITVPQNFINRLPMFTYSDEGNKSRPISSIHKRKTEVSTIDGSIAKNILITHRMPQFIENDEIPIEEPLHVMIMDDSNSNPDSILVHKFLPYSQPTCPICNQNYQSGVTEIRELPCGHIFHPDCIDTLLFNNSSLCPMCKKSVLPKQYFPATITNNMVRRERNLRRLRSRMNAPDQEIERSSDEHEVAQGIRKPFHDLIVNIKSTLSGRPRPSASTIYGTNQPVFLPRIAQVRIQPSVDNVLPISEVSRQEAVQQRSRELNAEQVPIPELDIEEERQRPKWRQKLSGAFPGF